MASLTQSRMSREERWNFHKFTLVSGQVVFKGGIACIDTATGKVTEGSVATTLRRIGEFEEDKDATAGDTPVTVRLDREWIVRRYATDNLTAANIGSDVYLKDDHTVSSTATGASKAGTMVDFDSTLPTDFAVGIVALGTF